MIRWLMTELTKRKILFWNYEDQHPCRKTYGGLDGLCTSWKWCSDQPGTGQSSRITGEAIFPGMICVTRVDGRQQWCQVHCKQTGTRLHVMWRKFKWEKVSQITDNNDHCCVKDSTHRRSRFWWQLYFRRIKHGTRPKSIIVAVCQRMQFYSKSGKMFQVVHTSILFVSSRRCQWVFEIVALNPMNDPW